MQLPPEVSRKEIEAEVREGTRKGKGIRYFRDWRANLPFSDIRGGGINRRLYIDNGVMGKRIADWIDPRMSRYHSPFLLRETPWGLANDIDRALKANNILTGDVDELQSDISGAFALYNSTPTEANGIQLIAELDRLHTLTLPAYIDLRMVYTHEDLTEVLLEPVNPESLVHPAPSLG